MTDLQLITRVQTAQDSAAIKELIKRHTGIYMDTVSSFSLSPLIANDVRQDRDTNIYLWANKYDPTRGMQFGTFVGERAKTLCINLYNRAPESVSFNEEVAPTNDTAINERVNRDDEMEELTERAKRVGDPKFYAIFKARFSGQKPKTWRTIGNEIGMTQEGARKLFLRHVGKLKEHVRT